MDKEPLGQLPPLTMTELEAIGGALDLAIDLGEALGSPTPLTTLHSLRATVAAATEQARAA